MKTINTTNAILETSQDGTPLDDDPTNKRHEDVHQWFHGIEHLERKASGYVFWKGACIEHFTFSCCIREREAALELASHCRSAEERGFPVTGRTTSRFSPFFDAPAGTPWLETMLNYYTMFAVGGKAKSLILSLQGRYAVAMEIMGGEIVLQYSFDECAQFALYQRLQDEGQTPCSGRLQVYDSFVTCMEEAQITPLFVHRVLNADISRLLAQEKNAA